MALHRDTETDVVRVVGHTIRRRRKALNMTLQTLAGISGVTIGYISQVERAENSPSLHTLYLICKALRIPLSSLFTDVEYGGDFDPIELGA